MSNAVEKLVFGRQLIGFLEENEGFLNLQSAYGKNKSILRLHKVVHTSSITNSKFRWAAVSRVQSHLRCAAGKRLRTDTFLAIYHRCNIHRTFNTTPSSLVCLGSATQSLESSCDVLLQLVIVTAIGQWMTSNRLKLNTDKTQFIWLGTRRTVSKVE